MDVFECFRKFWSFLVVTEHELVTHISLAHDEKLLHKYSGGENKRTTKKTARDLFNCVAQSLFGQAKRIRDDRLAYVPNGENFIRNTFAVEENVCVEQLCYDKNVEDLDTPKELLEADDTSKL